MLILHVAGGWRATHFPSHGPGAEQEIRHLVLQGLIHFMVSIQWTFLLLASTIQDKAVSVPRPQTLEVPRAGVSVHSQLSSQGEPQSVFPVEPVATDPEVTLSGIC